MKNDEKIIQLNGEKESKEKWFGEIYICASPTFNLFSSYGFVIHEILSDEWDFLKEKVKKNNFASQIPQENLLRTL